MKKPPQVLVVDDEPSVRTSIKRLLEAQGFRVDTYQDTRQLFQCGRSAEPTCVILDVNLPEVNGLDYQETLARLGIRVPIIFITGCGDVPGSVRAMHAGALDFIPKPFDPIHLTQVVRKALALDAQLLEEEKALADLRRRYNMLTMREREVLFAVVEGLLNKQVGYELGIGEKTVKVHRARVMEKMGIRSLPELVRIADRLRPYCDDIPSFAGLGY